jgi:hypothetical protein
VAEREKWYTMTQAGRLLGMGRTGVLKAIQRRRLEALVSEEMEGTQPGMLISESAIEAYRQSREHRGPGPGRAKRRRRRGADLPPNERRGRREVAATPVV